MDQHPISKKVGETQLGDHLNRNDLFDVFQLGFRIHHTTEAVLIRIRYDLIASNNRLMFMLVLCCTDTLNFSILLYRLEHIIVFKGTTLGF